MSFCDNNLDDAESYSGKGSEKHLSWKQLTTACGSAPNMRANTSVFYHDNTIWFVCGKSTGLTNEVWLFNTIDRKWAKKMTKGRAPSPRDGHAVAFSENNKKLYLFGGQGSPKPIHVANSSFDKIKVEFLATRQTYADFYEFDIDTGVWAEKEPSGRRTHSSGTTRSR